MVLSILLGLNGQNNEGRLLFDKGSTNREKMGAKHLIKEFPNKGWSVLSMNLLTKKIDNRGSTERKSGSGRPRSLRTAANVSMVQDMISSQDDAPCSHINPQKIQEHIKHCKLS